MAQTGFTYRYSQIQVSTNGLPAWFLSASIAARRSSGSSAWLGSGDYLRKCFQFKLVKSKNLERCVITWKWNYLKLLIHWKNQLPMNLIDICICPPEVDLVELTNLWIDNALPSIKTVTFQTVCQLEKWGKNQKLWLEICDTYEHANSAWLTIWHDIQLFTHVYLITILFFYITNSHMAVRYPFLPVDYLVNYIYSVIFND